MAYIAITDQEIAPNQPVSNDLLTKVKDNFDAHEAAIQAGLGGSNVPGVIPNGSLEADSDLDGIPDNWTVGVYSGGSRGIDKTDWAHGTRSMKFTASLSGGGNGGGWMLSDYVGISPIYAPPLWFGYKASVANIGIRITAQYYGATGPDNTPGAPIGNIVLWNSTSHKVNAWTIAVICRPPVYSGARYVKYLLEGGTTGGVAGSVWFDGIGVEPFIGPNLISHGINLPWTGSLQSGENFIGGAFGFTIPAGGVYSVIRFLCDVDPAFGYQSGMWGGNQEAHLTVRVSINNGAIYSDYQTSNIAASLSWTQSHLFSVLGGAAYIQRLTCNADISSLAPGAHTARFRGYPSYGGGGYFGWVPRLRSENLGHYLVNSGRQIDALTNAVVDGVGKPTVLTIP